MSTSPSKLTTFYHSFKEDVVTLKHQNYQLPDDYNYSTDRLTYSLLAPAVSLVAKIIAWFYAIIFLHLKVENKDLLKNINQGYFVYGNHTLPMGDSFTIFLLVPLTKVAAIVAPENLAIPVIGPLLPYGGVVPIPSNRHRLLDFNRAVLDKIKKKKAMFIYPEAHVWPYYTKIRPLELGSFHYPIETGAPVYCKTTTFQNRRWSKKPKVTVYLDGPITWNQDQSKIAQEKELRDKVQACLEKRSCLSTYEYVHYQFKGDINQ
ncbi:lysophospholipid acyltransferase family protein [Xylocopilactobacillus apicola]|uniref:1-acyl-sn-glycerol-3-phosphate acyltransferase n=1 Tax=Xylocopilactobacillus apicola TaxID=2932184 RepID=A0AAU9DH53_9LACO|nr:lysophospholipid acyltransferase family protein [Xylocopilactobacillus apicola]BDR59310.1 1-acyl-sn-glycerol-3-phosphate acyltransferase [Xylocopilactobacillus apicola]